MSQYPTIPSAFPTRLDGDIIFAEHMNHVQDEIQQITSGLLTGLFHNLIPAADLTYNLGIPTRRWKEVWADSINSGGSVTGQYLDLPELTPPAPGDPAANVARLHALDANGFSVLEVRDSNANVVRLASDNVLIGKVAVAGGIARGQVVFISGANGANPLIGLAKADTLATLPALGLALDPGANNAFIRVLLGGTLQLINTSAFAEGDRLFVSPVTAGSLVNVLPSPPAYAQRIGIVTRSHATQGEIVVVTTGVEAPPVASPPLPHAPSHAAGGGDPVNLLGLAGYPGGTVNFLRADGTFAPPPNPNLSGFVPYVGATTTVNLGAQSLVAGHISGVTGAFTGRVTMTGGVGTAFSQAHLEVGNASTPRISFHWHGVVASQIGMDSSGVIRTFDNPGTSYERFAAYDIDSHGTIKSYGAMCPGLASGHGGPGFQTGYQIYGSTSYGIYINTGLYLSGGLWTGAHVNAGTYIYSGSYVQSVGVMYPGNIVSGGSQGSWYIASHPSYGIYLNTGLYVPSTLYVGSTAYFLYGGGHALFVGDTPTTSLWGNYGGMMVANSNVALIGVRSIGYAVEGGLNAWVNHFYMGSWTAHPCTVRAGNLDKITMDPGYAPTVISNGKVQISDGLAIGAPVATSNMLRIIGLGSAPSSSGDVYNNGDGILRIG